MTLAVAECFDEDGVHIVDPRSVPVRFSNLKRMAQSPLHYWQSVQSGFEETLALRLGAGTHALLFKQSLIVFDGKVRNGKVWDKFAADHADKVILNRKEYAQAESVATAIHRHKRASELLFAKDAVIEERIHWKFMGRDCAGTPDVRTPSYVVDLKTTICSEPVKFNRDGRWRSYHAQLAWYLDAVLQAGLGAPAEAYIVAVESNPPHPVTVMRLTERALDAGRKLVRPWFERLIGCEQENYWPAYVADVVEFDVDDTEFSLRIEGEDVDF